MFGGLIEFIRQSLFSVINQITSKKIRGLRQVSWSSGLLLRFAQKNRGMTRVLIGDALSNKTASAGAHQCHYSTGLKQR